ncbi:unnamed protein product [Spodoptera exigua]|nr:unnamed protein product [Spodoptera exigua]
MPLVPQDVRGVSTRAMSEAQRVREEGAAAQTSDAEAKPVQVDLLLQLQQMMAEQARRQEEQARRQEEQARRQEEQARCQAEQLRELKEEQARRQEEQARRQEEQARCQAEQLRELKEDQARRQEDQARRQEEQARRLEEMHRDFTKGLQKAVERVQEVEEGLGKLEHRVMAIEERVEEEISKIKQQVASPSPLKSRSRLAAVFDTSNVASMIEGTLLQAFIDGIRDPEVRAAVHLGHHKIMKEALAHALEVEAVRGNSRTLRLREMTTTEQVPPRRRNFMCYGCGERGHIRSDCPKKMIRKDAAVSTSDQQGNLT